MKKLFCFYLFFYRVRTKIIFVPFLIANSSFNFCECDACLDFCKCCCEDCWKKNEAEDFVNKKWLAVNENKEDFVLKLFIKVEKNKYKSKKGKIQIELEEKENKTKIKVSDTLKDILKLDTKKWALFEIRYNKKEKKEETAYLYCSDIESVRDVSKSSIYNGIFEEKEKFLSISVLDCDTSKVTNIEYMFFSCSSLTELNIPNFDTSKVTNMDSMFFNCNSLQTVIVSEKAKDTILQNLKNEELIFEVKDNKDGTYTLTRKIESE